MAAAASDKSGGSGDAAREAALSERKTAVTAAIRSGNSLLAVRTALDSPPFGTKNKDLKTMNFDVVTAAMLSARTDDAISKVVDELTMEECDLLMKFIYRGLSKGDQTLQFLKWHATTLAKAGPSSIVRVITDKRRVV
ncbi:hypothetical protein FNF27_04856 [Cafeteria roenbergensis]|uniref:Actin-related protein 2/3 complex subunit 5 n=1 Tax=Cafeteria roenbergensis TaxID=33653 RepID=A0A5A8D4W8_CAFRO|nr:hypothetical protein FNF29_05321 [Cafeteria roenbergensis]KAA0160225.1 hypothetical protein FNF31_04392 [Cafeteria roenbergensis]KAA0166927.1 hypothetical protein FNF28_02999 [Cafeteria roenbergensis]KAA0173706.1 hypothetical protein FNF27_04856 [Cafeteria roenbergensis]|eukprot:KAA0150309.1 hypothetical protein FNF29_05321 [Cafeteria roenbergensis]